jgi:NAD dependent epimerase/dehydratase family enzyme
LRLGLGGPIGSGGQRMSWIAIDEIPRVLLHVLANESLQGAVNAVAPRPVTNRDFSKTLGEVLHRPAVLPLPGFVAKAALGEMAEELLLSSTAAIPRKLVESGYEFQHADLRGALSHLLGVGDPA